MTFDVTVTPPPTTTRLYQQVNHDSVVRANVKQTVQVVVQSGNEGSGTLLGSSFGDGCTQTSGPAMPLAPAPGAARQAANRDYPAGRNATIQLRARPMQTGTAVYDCTLSMVDGFGAPVTSVATVPSTSVADLAPRTGPATTLVIAGPVRVRRARRYSRCNPRVAVPGDPAEPGPAAPAT